MVLSLYLLGIIMMVVAGLVLRKTTFREGETPFVMELPAYRVPSVKNVARRLWDRARDFIVRAGTIIFAMSVVVWFLQSFSPSLQMVTDPAQSMFGRLGAFHRPHLCSLGLWRMAKERVAALRAGGQGSGGFHHAGALRRRFHGAAWHAAGDKVHPALCLRLPRLHLLYTPCVSAVAAIRRETGSWKYTLLSVLMQLGVAYVMALLVFQVGSLLGA